MDELDQLIKGFRAENLFSPIQRSEPREGTLAGFDFVEEFDIVKETSTEDCP